MVCKRCISRRKNDTKATNIALQGGGQGVGSGADENTSQPANITLMYLALAPFQTVFNFLGQ